MPKGVEHERTAYFTAKFIRVIYPLMPKGVEHQPRKAMDTAHLRVIYPLMPKGVEHDSQHQPSCWKIGGDLSVDAERR